MKELYLIESKSPVSSYVSTYPPTRNRKSFNTIKSLLDYIEKEIVNRRGTVNFEIETIEVVE